MVDLTHQIWIQAPPDKVYAAIATAAGLRSWWTADSRADDRAGGKAEFGFDRRGTVFRMDIDTLTPDRRVVWRCTGDPDEWNGTVLTWDLAPEKTGTTLRFTHGHWKALTDFCASCNTTWGELLHRIKGYVEGRNPGPHWSE